MNQDSIMISRKKKGIFLKWRSPDQPFESQFGSVLTTGIWLFFWAAGETAAIILLIQGFRLLTNARSDESLRVFLEGLLASPPLLIGIILVILFFLGWLGFWTLCGIINIAKLLVYLHPSINSYLWLSGNRLRIKELAGWIYPVKDDSLFYYEIERVEIDEQKMHILLFAQGRKIELGKGLARNDLNFISQEIFAWLDGLPDAPPEDRPGSLNVKYLDSKTILSWKNPVQRNLNTYTNSLGILFWMLGWFLGEVFALAFVIFGIHELWNRVFGNEGITPLTGTLSMILALSFMMTWLLIWTLGGLLCVANLLTFVGLGPRTRVILKKNRMTLQLLYAGIMPLGKRRAELNEIESISFEEMDGIHQARLCVGKEEFELGETLVYSDRMKLYQIIKEWYAEQQSQQIFPA